MDKSINEAEDIIELGFEKIAKYGEEYKKVYLEDKLKENNLTKEILLEDWWESFKFFCGRCFYQGRRDELSRIFEKITIDTLENYLGKNDTEREKSVKELIKKGFLEFSLLKKQDKSKLKDIYNSLRHNPIIQKLENGFSKKGYKGKVNDRLMVLHLLVFCTHIKDKNLVEYFKAKIEASNIEIAYNELNNIISIGPKIASFLLRDIVLLYNLEDEISQEDRVYIQPI
ncbi:MAG: hypothetical protein ACFFAN_04095, partial [Promethearchaeota archaeon]